MSFKVKVKCCVGNNEVYYYYNTDNVGTSGYMNHMPQNIILINRKFMIILQNLTIPIINSIIFIKSITKAMTETVSIFEGQSESGMVRAGYY